MEYYRRRRLEGAITAIFSISGGWRYCRPRKPGKGTGDWRGRWEM